MAAACSHRLLSPCRVLAEDPNVVAQAATQFPFDSVAMLTVACLAKWVLPPAPCSLQVRSHVPSSLTSPSVEGPRLLMAAPAPLVSKPFSQARAKR